LTWIADTCPHLSELCAHAISARHLAAKQTVVQAMDWTGQVTTKLDDLIRSAVPTAALTPRKGAAPPLIHAEVFGRETTNLPRDHHP
jgi:hypothetical protein